jgi:hypothetical protein
MGKISLEVILKVIDVAASVLIAIVDAINGRKKDDSTGSVKKK